MLEGFFYVAQLLADLLRVQDLGCKSVDLREVTSGIRN